MQISRPALVLDVGNTRVKAALFGGGALLRHGVLSGVEGKDLVGWLEGTVPARTVILNSGQVPATLLDAVNERSTVLVLTGKSPSPLRSAYTTPETLGTDRLANAVAVRLMFPDRPALAIDLGTCITYDLVDATGLYHGGAISPGVRMRAQAMNAYTAKLPAVEVDALPPLLGASTVEALKSGVFQGVLAELSGFIEALRQQWPQLAVVLTGGDAPLFVAHLRNSIFADPLLTLRGAYALLEHQNDQGLGARGPGL